MVDTSWAIYSIILATLLSTANLWAAIAHLEKSGILHQFYTRMTKLNAIVKPMRRLMGHIKFTRFYWTLVEFFLVI
jgi:hypothetical protein